MPLKYRQALQLPASVMRVGAPLPWGYTNLLCIVPILIYVPSRAVQNFLAAGKYSGCTQRALRALKGHAFDHQALKGHSGHSKGMLLIIKHLRPSGTSCTPNSPEI
eukprot:1143655-Pelagomonas_calceolata.AAC.19